MSHRTRRDHKKGVERDIEVDSAKEDARNSVDMEEVGGLSSEEARERLGKFGYNEIEEKSESWWQRLFRRFWGPIPWMIELAATLSALVQRW